MNVHGLRFVRAYVRTLQRVDKAGFTMFNGIDTFLSTIDGKEFARCKHTETGTNPKKIPLKQNQSDYNKEVFFLQ